MPDGKRKRPPQVGTIGGLMAQELGYCDVRECHHSPNARSRGARARTRSRLPHRRLRRAEPVFQILREVAQALGQGLADTNRRDARPGAGQARPRLFASKVSTSSPAPTATLVRPRNPPLPSTMRRVFASQGHAGALTAADTNPQLPASQGCGSVYRLRTSGSAGRLWRNNEDDLLDGDSRHACSSPLKLRGQSFWICCC